MAKYCIFCGKKPSSKNKEHVLPRWLLELTGDPKRKVRLGWVKSLTDGLRHREFAFDQFTFPACELCNQSYSELEGNVKRIIVLLLEGGRVLEVDFAVLLDWFDKVRIGLWLGFQQLDKNIYGVRPQFHISRRIGQYDRMLILERSAGDVNRLTIFGGDTPSFARLPGVFALAINHLIFTNVSTAFLLARRLGFPHPASIRMLAETMGLEFTLWAGVRGCTGPCRNNLCQKEVSRSISFGSRLAS